MLLSAARVAAALAFWGLIWQGAAMIVNQELIVPRPLTVLRQLLDLGAAAGFWQAAGVSLLRIFIGYVLGIAAGVLAAFLTSTFRAADWLLSPAIRVDAGRLLYHSEPAVDRAHARARLYLHAHRHPHRMGQPLHGGARDGP